MTFNISGNVVIDNDRLVRNISGASGSRPASPVTGQLFFNTTSGELEVWNGSAWKGKGTYDEPSTPQIWGWGYRLPIGNGVATPGFVSSPITTTGGITDWVQINAGQRHTIALRANGQAWAWGQATNGRLGDNSIQAKSSPVSVLGGFTDWVQVSAGYRASAAVRANGTAWCWGNNDTGECGDNTATNRSSPVSVVGGFNDWVQIASCGYHTVAIRANGTAWGWGKGQYGQLGNNTAQGKSSPVSVVGFSDWVQISGGFFHTVALRANGTVWTWGSNYRGQLGDDTTTDRSSPVSVVGGYTNWFQIDAGSSQTVGLRGSGNSTAAWCWGAGSVGRLGNNSTLNRSSPESVVGGFTDWVQISAGSYTTVAIRANGTAWAWGEAANGNLGNNSTQAQSSPVSVVGGFADWVMIGGGGSFGTALRSAAPRRTDNPGIRP